MTDGDALLDAIRENPEDDLPRLAFADLCEEAGDDARAEFIRVQIQMARIGLCDCPTPKLAGPGPARRRDRCGTCVFCRPASRVAELHAALADELFGRLPFGFAHTWEHPSLSIDEAVTWSTLYLSRGFVGEVASPQQAFLAHAGAIFSAHPVTTLRLVDRRAANWTTASERFPCWSWSYSPVHANSPCWLHADLFRLLRSGTRGTESTVRYFAATDALADLQQAAVAFGREAARRLRDDFSRCRS